MSSNPLEEAGEQALRQAWDPRAPGFPSLPAQLPFELVIAPTGSWVTIECDTSEPTDAALVDAIDAYVRAWARAGERGEFQAVLPLAERPPDFCLVLSQPVVGDEFVQWQCQMPDVPIQSLNILIRVLALFSESAARLTHVYIG